MKKRERMKKWSAFTSGSLIWEVFVYT